MSARVPFTFFDHTGDMGIRLTASSLEELFESAAQAFTQTLCDLHSVRPSLTRTMALEASRTELLLVDWLGELLYAFEVDDFLVRSASVALVPPGSDAGWRLVATIRGEPLDAGRHHIQRLVKGVTYHGLSIEMSSGVVRASIILDI